MCLVSMLMETKSLTSQAPHDSTAAARAVQTPLDRACCRRSYDQAQSRFFLRVIWAGKDHGSTLPSIGLETRSRQDFQSPCPSERIMATLSLETVATPSFNIIITSPSESRSKHPTCPRVARISIDDAD